ncbi:MAG TPA: hypothetical protein VK879_10510 [Candidatus Sulfomarinibacteraceae bacterium]|nr:hypothetical protein [Candidatus Sulfomarinibacteraceae bacterium]
MIACLSISYFASTVERRDDAALARAPLVVGGQNWEPRPLFGYSREAALKGIMPGMSLRQAHVLSPDSHFVPSTLPKYLGAAGEIVDILTDFTHLVEPHNLWQPDKSQSFVTTTARALPAQYYLDLETLPEREAAPLVQEIGRTVRKQTRFSPAVGLAANRFTAQVAATVCRPDRLRPVAPDDERAFLAGQPVAFLPLDKEMARRLRLLGIRTMGQFAALSRAAVQEQFGTEALTLYRLARGEAEAQPRPQAPEPQLQLTRQFEPALTDRLTLQAVMERMASELAGELWRRHRAAGALTLWLEDEQGAREERQVLRQPAATAGQLSQHLYALLAQLPLRGPVTALSVSAGELAPRTAQQLSLFTSVTTRQVERLLPTIMARYKTVRFYRPRLSDSAHPLPERRFQLQPL